ncbi:hypothetical protein LJB86_03795 [Deltaproteobacteria bacterium OttesenSCG-928-M10]|nr:hypothetical protein [Deltaproteobacteria bacterium OttesenSCG-928-M10]
MKKNFLTTLVLTFLLIVTFSVQADARPDPPKSEFIGILPLIYEGDEAVLPDMTGKLYQDESDIRKEILTNIMAVTAIHDRTGQPVTGEQRVEIRFPVNTGNPLVDRTVAQKAITDFQRAIKSMEFEPNGQNRIGQFGLVGELTALGVTGRFYYSYGDFYVFKPSVGVLSLLYFYEHDGGGAHPFFGYSALSFDLSTGEELKNEGIFFNPQISIEPYWNLIRHELTERGWFLPYYDDYISRYIQDTDFLLHNLLLNKHGATIVIGPYLFGNTIHIFDISKDEMIKMGARPEIWD